MGNIFYIGLLSFFGGISQDIFIPILPLFLANVLSIEAQLVELKEFAAKEKLGRMKFAEMLSLIEKGKADGIISWHPDRLARNSVDGGKIIHFVDRGLIKSLKFPTFWFEATPQGLFMLNIAFGQSKYFVDNLRENVKRGLRQKYATALGPAGLRWVILTILRREELILVPRKLL